MNYTFKAPINLLAGFLVLFTTLALSPITASAGYLSGNKVLHYTPTEAEIMSLLTYYSLEDDNDIAQINVKIYNKNDDLIYSDKVCMRLNECDERLNQILNQCDFITEVDNTKIYVLQQ